MAQIDNTYLGTSVGISSGYDFLSGAPIDRRATMPNLDGLDALIDLVAVYQGMQVFVESESAYFQYVGGETPWKKLAIGSIDDLKREIGTSAIGGMNFKGAIGAVPTGTHAIGDMYKMTDVITFTNTQDAQGQGFTTKVGDAIVCDANGKWFLIPSGDDALSIQGNTSATVADCVQAINKMNAISTAQGEAVSLVVDNVQDIVTQLTWGTF